MSKKVRILIVGNGFGGVYTLKHLHKIFCDNPLVELSMVGNKNYFLFTPLLHEVATGGINPSNIIEPIRKVLGCCLQNFYLGQAEMINLESHTVKVGEELIGYDYLILAPGAETNYYNIPGAEKFSFALKTLDDAIKIKNHLVRQMECALHAVDLEKRKEMLRFVVAGGGPTGVELAAELEELLAETLATYYPKEIMKDVSIILVQGNPELVAQFNPKIRRKSLEVLEKKGVRVMLKTLVKEVGPTYISLDIDRKIQTDTVIWVAGVRPASLSFDLPVYKSPDGRLLVNEYFQLENYPEVFAIGDVALFKNKDGTPLPALAQVATKEAKAVAKNIKALLSNRPMKKFKYRSSGHLLSLGQWMAAGEIYNFTFSGRLAWWIWRTIYLFKLVSFRKKIRVALDWTINIFSPRDISQF